VDCDSLIYFSYGVLSISLYPRETGQHTWFAELNSSHFIVANMQFFVPLTWVGVTTIAHMNYRATIADLSPASRETGRKDLPLPDVSRLLSARSYTCAMNFRCVRIYPNPALLYQQRMHGGPRPMRLEPPHDVD